MWNGKMKAVTFSYDDGVHQDIRLVELFNKYGLKATFNINSGRLNGVNNPWDLGYKVVDKPTVYEAEMPKLYEGHEVAVHTLTHPFLPDLPDEDIIREVDEDRKNLERIMGYEVKGMAYPCGGANNDDRVAGVIRDNTPIKYARTIVSNFSFDVQENLLRFNPTVEHNMFDKMDELADKFIALKPDKPQIFYIWGHSYELEKDNMWELLEKFLEKISGHDDIFYGTNSEVLLFEK